MPRGGIAILVLFAAGSRCLVPPGRSMAHNREPPDRSAGHGLSRRNDLDGSARRPGGGQNNGHRGDGRRRGERPLSGHRQARLHPAGDHARPSPASWAMLWSPRSCRSCPRGHIDPPTEHMKYPGTISVTEETFERLLTDICASFRSARLSAHRPDRRQRRQPAGHEGGRRPAQRGNGPAAACESTTFRNTTTTTRDSLAGEQGIRQTDEGLHDDFAVTAQLMAVDPTTVRMRAAHRRRQVPHQWHRPGPRRLDHRLGEQDYHRTERKRLQGQSAWRGRRESNGQH